MTVQDILNFTETFAPVETAADFDNCGILVGDKNQKVTKALLALDITNDVVNEAKKIGAELIISHHPVIFNPLKKVIKGSVVFNLIKNDLTALCLHTNLDLSPILGVNTSLADALGMVNCSFAENSYGYIGELKEPMSSREFAEMAKEKLNCKGIKYTEKDAVKKVCVSSGAGAEELFTALNHNCDLFLTGEMKHHLYIEALQKDIAVVEVGHFKSENIVITPLMEKLQQEFPNIVFKKTTSVIDNVKYL